MDIGSRVANNKVETFRDNKNERERERNENQYELMGSEWRIYWGVKSKTFVEKNSKEVQKELGKNQ